VTVGLLASTAVATHGGTHVELQPDTKGCNGVLPSTDGNTDMRLVGGTLEPGGTAVFQITYPLDASSVGKEFTITACAFIGGVAALKYLVDKVRVQKVMPTDAEMSGVANEDMFLNGQLGMLYSGIWMFDKFSQAKFKWDIAVEPGGTRKATHFFSNAAVISRTTKNPELAWKWVKFLASNPATVKTRIDRAWELPALSLAQRTLIDSYLKKPMPANREAVFDSLQYAIPPPVVENQSQLQDIINQELEAARLGTKTVEQALADAQKRVEAIVKR